MKLHSRAADELEMIRSQRPRGLVADWQPDRHNTNSTDATELPEHLNSKTTATQIKST